MNILTIFLLMCLVCAWAFFFWLHTPKGKKWLDEL